MENIEKLMYEKNLLASKLAELEVVHKQETEMMRDHIERLDTQYKHLAIAYSKLEDEKLEFVRRDMQRDARVEELQDDVKREASRADWFKNEVGRVTELMRAHGIESGDPGDNEVLVEVVESQNGERHLIQKSSINDWRVGPIKLYTRTQSLHIDDEHKSVTEDVPLCFLKKVSDLFECCYEHCHYSDPNGFPVYTRPQQTEMPEAN
ncbi:hypothetical protein [uncultured Microbulbifer sp.]|uniref:hypothetical protein n=1 Tax=uncultured Microbulbifer sp. TaxID=348147 RepID=UPI002620630C|nr:hypothetical protein [uncultured Microbulbifer sp.]